VTAAKLSMDSSELPLRNASGILQRRVVQGRVAIDASFEAGMSLLICDPFLYKLTTISAQKLDVQ
jgi:hypothetical protein